MEQNNVQSSINRTEYHGEEPMRRHTRARQIYKSPAIAGMLSVIPGLGQVYVGYYKQGLMNLAIFALAITISTNLEDTGLSPLFGLFIPFWFFYTLIDAVRRASLYNLSVDGETGIKLPEDMPFPALNGSLAGGVTLVIIGMLLFLNTKFDISLEWLADWWPLAIVAGGVYLIYKNLEERKRSANPIEASDPAESKLS